MKSGYGDSNGLYLSDMKQTGSGLYLSGETNNSNLVTRIGGSLYSKQWDNNYKGMHVPNGHGSLFSAMDQDARIIAQCNANLEKYYLKPNVQKEPALLPLPPVQNIVEPLQLIPVQNIIEQPEQILEEEEDLLAMIQKLKASLKERDDLIKDKDVQLQNKDIQLQEKDNIIENLTIDKDNLTTTNKDLTKRLESSDKVIDELKVDKQELKLDKYNLGKTITLLEEANQAKVIKIEEFKNLLHVKDEKYDLLKNQYDDIIGVGMHQNEDGVLVTGANHESSQSNSFELI